MEKIVGVRGDKSLQRGSKGVIFFRKFLEIIGKYCRGARQQISLDRFLKGEFFRKYTLINFEKCGSELSHQHEGAEDVNNLSYELHACAQNSVPCAPVPVLVLKHRDPVLEHRGSCALCASYLCRAQISVLLCAPPCAQGRKLCRSTQTCAKHRPQHRKFLTG